jgi:hypothetical protein
LVGGQTHIIKWRSQNIEKVLIKLCALTPLLEKGYTCHTLSRIPDAGIISSGFFSWKVDPNDPFIPCNNACKIEIYEVRDGIVSEVFDASDNYFSIARSGLWGWNYCTPTSQCSAGQGDCDTDADCTTGYCAQNVGAKYGQVSSMDVCEEKAEKSITVRRGDI